MLEYARWKYWLVSGVLILALLLALPNLFGDQDALQVTRKNGDAMTASTQDVVLAALAKRNIVTDGSYVDSGRLMIRFAQLPEQLKARDAVNEDLATDYRSALTKAPKTPIWLRRLGFKPMSLGLDLRGGLYLLYQIDVAEPVKQLLSSYEQGFRRTLNDNKVSFTGSSVITGSDATDRSVLNTVQIVLAPGADAVAALKALQNANSDLSFAQGKGDASNTISMVLTPTQISERQSYAIDQTRTTLQTRINALGVAESIVQQQGKDRLNVQLPGVSNSADVKDILGKVATVQFRLEDWQDSVADAISTGRAPLGAKLYNMKGGGSVLLKRDVIATGDQLTNATSTVGTSGPEVRVQLNGRAGTSMLRATSANVNRNMAVVYIETNKKTVEEGGKKVEHVVTEETVISLANIREAFGNSFQITGLTAGESRELALLLRSGSLPTNVFLVEERAIGASLGQDNISKGTRALIIGMLLVFAFMAIYYKRFGWVANLVLMANVVLLAALLSMLGSALSLPGIAGMVLTVGMAVDANILIYERIREEVRNGVSSQAAIRAGFDKAFSAIADSNITTLIAGIVLWMFGSGPIRGFAVVLTLGIATSMFTAIVGSRALITLIYGGSKRVERLSI
jgi:preprotein translocase subunit SecD